MRGINKVNAYFIILVLTLSFCCVVLYSLQGIFMNDLSSLFSLQAIFFHYLFRFDHELGLFWLVNYLFHFMKI